jgi:hypothetical protein
LRQRIKTTARALAGFVGVARATELEGMIRKGAAAFRKDHATSKQRAKSAKTIRPNLNAL